MSLTVDDIAKMMLEEIRELRRQVHEQERKREDDRAVIFAILAHVGSVTHLSVKRAAELRKCSERTIYREIERGTYRLEQIPGTSEKGIPIESFHRNWMPVESIRTAIERQKAEGGTLPPHGTPRRA